MSFLSLPRRMRRWIFPLLPAALALVVGGCELINPDEQVPAYLRILPFDYSPGMPDAPVSTLQPNGPDAWVYVSGELLGVFELPATVPVLKTGNPTINIRPGIYPDGQKGSRLIYPFYKGYEPTGLNLQPKQVITLRPTTSFDPALTRPFDEVKEDFDRTDLNDVTFKLATAANYRLESNVQTDPTGLTLQIPGNFGGVGLVRGIEGRTDQFFLDSDFYGFLPQKGAPVYVELDYRSTMPFRVGVAWSTQPSNPTSLTRSAELTVFPKEAWTKLYVNLTDEVSYVNNQAAKFKIFIQGQPTGAAGEYLALDNIRLVRRN